jgi:hypothetical protein
MNVQHTGATGFSGKALDTVVYLILFAITFLLYSSTLGHGFIFSWDDYDYVVNNPSIRGFSIDHIKTVFSTFLIGNYAPLHLISYMLDYQFWGLDPAGYHFGNILIHALNGILVYRLFVKLELSETAALFGAILFALHPAQVESVAWVAERKNVLSAMFFLLALHSYINYKKASNGRARNYIVSLGLLACALLTKSAAVIFPVVIICYDFCYCTEPRRLKLVDKFPFLLLTLAACILTIMSQDKNAGGGMMGFPGGTPLTAIWTMIPVFLSYLKDLVFPVDLSPYYIVPIRKSIDGTVIGSTVILLCLTGLAVISINRWPRLFFFISVYFVALLPVLQIVPILTLKNDRYLYFPMIGAAGGVALIFSELIKKKACIRNITVACAIVACTAYGYSTYYQSQIWNNSIVLWQFALRKNPENMLAWLMLAKGYTHIGNSREAFSAISTYNKLKFKYGPLRGWEGLGA